MKSSPAHRICAFLVVLAVLAGSPIRVISAGSADNPMALCDVGAMPMADCCVGCRDEGTVGEICAAFCTAVLAVLAADVGSLEDRCTACPDGPRNNGPTWRPGLDPYPPKPFLDD